MCIPSLDAWDQFVWPLTAAVPQASTEVEQYGYCRGHAMDLGPVMPASQFKVTDEEGTHLCVVQALVFKGSILAYNPTRNEVEWVPTRSITNDLSWAKEKSAMALVNYVPRISQEAACIEGLGTHHLMSWADNSSSEEEDDEQMEEEDGKQEGDEPEGDEHEEAEGQGEADPRSQKWGSIMDNEEPLTFDDPQSDSDTTVGGRSPVCLTPQVLESPQETAIEVHAWDSEVEAL